ncbi:tetratricopeptide repeat protein [Planctomycetes bacterium K23_9]|uniref:tetratricopeptide repeat protein n=1 Tax=Stieleria marina TaxID=1930275 RepID=UPI0011A64C05
MHHLTVLADHGDLPGKLALVQMYVVSKQTQKAVDLIRTLVVKRPDLYLQLATLLREQGEVESSRRAASRAAEHFRQVIQNEDAHNYSDFIALSRSLLILKQRTEAIDVLRTGVKKFPELEPTLTQHLVEKSDRLRGNDIAQSTRLLREAAELSPDAIAVWIRVCELRNETCIYDRANTILATFKRQQKSNGAIDIVLGAQAFLDGRVDQAVNSLQNAVDRSTINSRNHQLALNNLASYLAQVDPPRFDQAKSLIDGLIAAHPQNSEYLFTRGNILAVEGKVEAAVVDLEAALSMGARDQRLVQKLVGLYEQLGQTVKAAALRDQQQWFLGMKARTTYGPRESLEGKLFSESVDQGASEEIVVED